MAAKQSAALVFLTSDSGEDIDLIIDGNEGDRYVRPLGNEDL